MLTQVETSELIELIGIAKPINSRIKALTQSLELGLNKGRGKDSITTSLGTRRGFDKEGFEKKHPEIAREFAIETTVKNKKIETNKKPVSLDNLRDEISSLKHKLSSLEGKAQKAINPVLNQGALQDLKAKLQK